MRVKLSPIGFFRSFFFLLWLTISVSANAARPTVNAYFSPSTVVRGENSTLNWSSSGATSCTSAPTSATSGTSVFPITVTGNQWSYTVTCVGPGGSNSSTAVVNVTAPPPPIVSAYFSPSTVVRGENSTLNWSSSGATSCTSAPTSATSGTSVFPITVTGNQWSYTVTCVGPGGSNSSTAVVNVTAPPPPIVSAYFSPNPVIRGQNSTLTWSSTGATSCDVPGNNATNGSKVYPITVTGNQWDALVSCTGPGGTTTKTVSLTVNNPPPPIVNAYFSPSTVVRGENSTLNWSSSGATSCTSAPTSATNGSAVYPITVAGSQWSYTVICTGPGGSTSSTAVVNVTTPPPPTINASFSPNPVIRGQNSTLTWSSTGATSCDVPGDSGTSGSKVYPITVTSNQWDALVSCTGPGGTTTKTVSLTVNNPPPPIVNAYFSPSTVVRGENSTLNWSSSGATSCTSAPTSATSGSAVYPITVAGSQWSYTVTCTGPGGSTSSTAVVNVTTPPPPTINASFSPNPVIRGQNSTLTWSSTGATSCDVPGDSGTSGSKVYPITVTGNQWDALVSCTGPGGTTTKTVTLVINNPPPPTVNAFFNPNPAIRGQNSTFTWSSSNAISCDVPGDSSPNGDKVYPITVMGDYWVVPISCTGPGGTTSKTITLKVDSPPPPEVTAFFSPNPVVRGRNSTLTWSSKGTTSCDVPGNPATSGSKTYPITLPSDQWVVPVSCTGPGGTATTTVVLDVRPDTANAPAAPNNITSQALENSIRIDWGLSLTATSYVLERDGEVVANLSSALISYVDTNVVAARLYTYRVKACTSVSVCSAWVTAYPISLPTASIALPAIIQAESFSTMYGVFVQDTTDIGGGQNIYNLGQDDWMSYSNKPVNIPVTGLYKVTYRIATTNGSSKLLLKESSTDAILDTSAFLPNTGGWQTWVDVARDVNLTQGIHRFKLQSASGNINLNWFKVEATANTVTGGGGGGGGTQAPASNTLVTSPLLKSAEDVYSAQADTTRPTGKPVGTLAGKFRVNESGAATYDVSIAVPDGIAGVTPQINLAYSSQGGKGLLGKGWSLGGISEISRCRQTLLHDSKALPITWTDSDRFCLDGQRLMLLSGSYGQSGSTYKTEIDTFVLVTAMGGTAGNPDYFKVEAKDGSTSIYGDENGTGASEVFATGKGVYSWSLKTFKDNMGNPISYIYEGNTTDHRVTEIRYAFGDQNPASNCGAFIKFGYEARPDAASGYVAGVELKNTQRLNKISVYNGGCSLANTTLSRVYKINYEQSASYSPNSYFYSSLLETIQECTKDSTDDSSCYPLTRFVWSNPMLSGFDRDDYVSDLTLSDTSATKSVSAATYMDINGNGVKDYIWSIEKSGITYIYEQEDFANAGTSTSSLTPLYSYNSKKAPKFEVIDYNADGHQDLLIYNAEIKSWMLFLSVIETNGWHLQKQSTPPPFASTEHIKVGDVNSDGLIDVIGLDLDNQIIKVYKLQKRSGASDTSNMYYEFNTGEIYSFVNNPNDGARFDENDEGFNFADFNGDGKVDIALKFTSPTISEFRVFLAGTSNNWEYYSTLSSSPNKAITKLNSIDINGDGLTDIAQFEGDFNCSNVGIENYSYLNCEESANGAWSYRLNNGIGFDPVVPINYLPAKQITSGITFVDINHDGYPDAVWRQKDFKSNPAATNLRPVFVKYWDSKLKDFNTESNYLYFWAYLTDNYQFMDVNGDSYTDIIRTELPLNANSYHLRAGNFIAPKATESGVIKSDQITSIIDGLRNTTKINYEPLSRSNSYLPIGDFKVSGNITTVCRPARFEGNMWYDSTCKVKDSIDSSDFYKQINNPFADQNISAQVPTLSVNGPLTLVTSVESNSPAANDSSPRGVDQNATSRIDYFYKNLRIQAAGRGMLGFGTLITTDAQTGVTTETSYRQDWPYIGSPVKTVVKTKTEKLLSRATNKWVNAVAANQTFHQNQRYYQPYLEKSVTESYSLNTDENLPNGDDSGPTMSADGMTVFGPAPLQTVTTDTLTPDEYGNVEIVTVTTTGSGDTLVKTTTNKYNGSPWQKRMGRLTSSKVVTTLNGQAGAGTDRTVSFDYYDESSVYKGLLKIERVEKNTTATFDNETLTTEYIYDSKGNKTEVRVTGYADAGLQETRKTINAYDDNGRYLTSTTNDEQQSSEIKARDPATGQVTSVEDINKIAAQVYYDAMGKEYLRVDDTGAWSRTDTAECVSGCPTGAKFYTLTRVSGGGQSINYFDSLGRTIRSSKLGFDGRMINVDTEYDRFGRTLRQSTPFFDNDMPSGWTTNKYDILGRVVKVTLPDNSYSTSKNVAYKTTITNHFGHTRSEQRNGLGQLVQVTDNLGGTIDYTYNTNGALLTAITKAPDRPTPIVVRMCYDLMGRKTAMLDPDKGGWLATTTDCLTVSATSVGWWTYTYNAFGELIGQRDAKGQVTTMKYDKLGRMIQRIDEEQTRWFYDKPLPTTSGSSSSSSSSVGSTGTPATKGKLMAVIVRKDNSSVTSCLAPDNCTQNVYDQYARPVETKVRYPNETTEYKATTKYDKIGRAYETRDALNGTVLNHSGVQTHYNSNGYAYRTIDIAPLGGGNGVLSEIISVNARGQVTEEWLNNSNFVTINTYNPNTGSLLTQTATTALAGALGTSKIQDETYTWDTLGNLKTRTNKNANVGSGANKNLTETFYYDGLNRLISSTGSGRGNQTASCANNSQDISYDGLGNITCKNGVGTYAYGANAGPHAVISTTLGGATTTYQYDANGNMEKDTDRTLTYTAFDMLKKISKGSDSTAFSYGADHARWQRTDIKSGVTTTTTYLGNVERIQKQSANEVEWRRSVGGAIFTFRTNTANQLVTNGTNSAYIFNDHLGSIDVITDANGKVTHSMSFDPWGARRNGETWTGLTEAQRITALKIGDGQIFKEPITQRGFTGHEMVDDMGIIHMNGRIYDAKLGRFLQADPKIDGVTNTQGYNRYSYVQNNPLNATDPSGFSSLRKLMGSIAAVILTIVAPGGAGMWYAAFVGATAGAFNAIANGGNVVLGAFTGMFTAFAGGGSGWNGFFQRGIVGGIGSEIMGGKFGNGFISAGIGGAFRGTGDFMVDFMVNALVGGTVSMLTGGKFENGATSAAVSFLVMTGARKISAGGVSPTAESPENEICKAAGKCHPHQFLQEDRDNINKEIAIAGKGILGKKYANKDAALIALHKSGLFDITKKYGIEVWANIDGITNEIYAIGTGFDAGLAIGVYENMRSDGDIAWHTHPRGSRMNGGDVSSVVRTGMYTRTASWIFADGGPNGPLEGVFNPNYSDPKNITHKMPSALYGSTTQFMTYQNNRFYTEPYVLQKP